MLKSLWFLMVSLFLVPFSFGANVNLDVDFNENSAVFNYLLEFGEEQLICQHSVYLYVE